MGGQEFFHFQVVTQVGGPQGPPEAGDPADGPPKRCFRDRSVPEQAVQSFFHVNDFPAQGRRFPLH